MKELAMARRTPTTKGDEIVAYTTRHLRRDLLDKARVLAALRRTTIEDVVNLALDAGLRRLMGKG